MMKKEDEFLNPYFYDPFNEFGTPDRSGVQMVMEGFEDIVISEQLTFYNQIKSIADHQLEM